jgi:hypothetical protein
MEKEHTIFVSLSIGRNAEGKKIFLSDAMRIAEDVELSRGFCFRTTSSTVPADVQVSASSDHPMAPLPMDLDAVEFAQDQCANCKGFGHWAKDCSSPKYTNRGRGSL